MTIDERIEALRASLTIISRNLMDLAETQTVKVARVRMADAENGYTGVTRDRAGGIVRSLDALWNSYLLLARNMEEAMRLHRRSNMFKSFDDEVLGLLEGQSIELRAEHIPVTSRGLLSDANSTHCAAPKDVLAEMERQFAEVRDMVAALEEAQSKSSSRVEELRGQVSGIAEWSRRLGREYAGPANLDSLLDNAARDPLACAGAVTLVENLLERDRLALKAAEEGVGNLRRGLAKASDSLGALGGGDAARFGPWLLSIKQAADAGNVGPAQVGLDRWREALNERMAERDRLLAQERGAAEEAAELSGRLRALQAKAKALAERGAPLPKGLPSLDAHASRTLEATPFDAAAARRVVAAFEAALKR